MLVSASSHVVLGGTLIYATCTTTRKENEEVIAAFLASEAGVQFEQVSLGEDVAFREYLRPGGPDAHFAAKLRRKA